MNSLDSMNICNGYQRTYVCTRKIKESFQSMDIDFNYICRCTTR